MISYKYFEGDSSSYWYSNADRDYQGLPGSFSCLLEGRIMLYKHWPFTFLVLAQLGSPTGMSPRSICFLDADSPPPRQSWHNLFLSVDFSDHWGWINFSLIHALIYCIYIFSYVLLSQVIIYVFVSIAKLLGHYSTFLYLLWKLQYRTESDTLEVLNKRQVNVWMKNISLLDASYWLLKQRVECVCDSRLPVGCTGKTRRRKASQLRTSYWKT